MMSVRIAPHGGKRWLARTGAVVLAGGLLAACGGGAGGGGGLYGGQSSGGSGHDRTAAGSASLSTRTVPGLGKVLVNGRGMTVYTTEQEKEGKIRCVKDCLGFWFPVTVPAGTDPALPGVASERLGTVERGNDSTVQVTYEEAPLYTFRLDNKPGMAKGDDLTDEFGGTTFTWHAVVLESTGDSSPQQPAEGGYGDPMY